MIPRVRNLANQMRLKKEQGDEKFVLLLGAGASISSGVKPTSTIIEELLKKYDTENTDGDILGRFDQLWKRTPNATRRGFLEPYLKITNPPSVGYEKLAELVKAGYFDLILTFNFDDLLETALLSIRFYDTQKVIRGETIEDGMQTLVDNKEPRVKIIKPHGSLRSTDLFLFDAKEMRRYPESIETLIKKMTARDIIVCGYAFNDDCVKHAFAEQGGSIFCVNPGGVPRGLLGFLEDRKSENIDIRADFDTFFSELHRELLESETEAADSGKPPANPFKFLESYEKADSDSFQGREGNVKDFFTYLETWTPPAPVILIVGPSKAGKTSLIRAGLLRRLEESKYRLAYIRCRENLEKPENLENYVPADLAQKGLARDDDDLPSALKHFGAASPDRRAILILDQFERLMCRFMDGTELKTTELSEFLAAQLFAGSNDNLTIVLSVTDDRKTNFVTTLFQECNKNRLMPGTVSCDAFSRKDVVRIMQSLASTAGFDFDPQIIESLADNFMKARDSQDPEQRFTLAHIHAICHILATTRRVTYESYKLAFDKQNMDALHQAINVSEFTSFAEDCAWPESAWFRNMLKVPLRESKKLIAKFIRDHKEELVPRDQLRAAVLNGQTPDVEAAGPLALR